MAHCDRRMDFAVGVIIGRTFYEVCNIVAGLTVALIALASVFDVNYFDAKTAVCLINFIRITFLVNFTH